MKDKKQHFSKKEIKKHIHRKNQSFGNMFYSEQRIDLLIIAISGAGIYVCLETIKFLSGQTDIIGVGIKLSGCFLLGAIIANFIGQLLAKHANKHDYLMCVCVEEQDNCGFNEHDKKAEAFSKWVNITNFLSMGFMFAGLILLVVFFSTYF